MIEDKATARKWYQKAADIGLAVSQYNLGIYAIYSHLILEKGLMYVAGVGGEVDLSKAFDLYTKSATQGYSAAQHNLGKWAVIRNFR